MWDRWTSSPSPWEQEPVCRPVNDSSSSRWDPLLSPTLRTLKAGPPSSLPRQSRFLPNIVCSPILSLLHGCGASPTPEDAASAFSISILCFPTELSPTFWTGCCPDCQPCGARAILPAQTRIRHAQLASRPGTANHGASTVDLGLSTDSSD